MANTVFIVEVGFAQSNKEAKRLIASGDISLGEVRLTDPLGEVTRDLLGMEQRVSHGRKKHKVVRVRD